MRSHNSIPLGATLMTFVTIIFFLGMIYNRFEALEKRFNEYVARQEAKENAYISQFGSQEKALNDVRVSMSTIEARLPAVRGATTRIASPSSTLVIPTPKKVPTPTGKK